MSFYDRHHTKALKIWNKARREGWLAEQLKGNAKGKVASKEAFIAGYICAVVDNVEVILNKEKQDGIH